MHTPRRFMTTNTPQIQPPSFDDLSYWRQPLGETSSGDESDHRSPFSPRPTIGVLPATRTPRSITKVNEDWYRRDTASDSPEGRRSRSVERRSRSMEPGQRLPSSMALPTSASRSPPMVRFSQDQPASEVLEEARRWSAELEQRRSMQMTSPSPAGSAALGRALAARQQNKGLSGLKSPDSEWTPSSAGVPVSAMEQMDDYLAVDDDSDLVSQLKGALLSKLIPVCRALDITSINELRDYGYDELAFDMRVHAGYTLLPNTWRKVQMLVGRGGGSEGSMASTPQPIITASAIDAQKSKAALLANENAMAGGGGGGGGGGVVAAAAKARIGTRANLHPPPWTIGTVAIPSANGRHRPSAAVQLRAHQALLPPLCTVGDWSRRPAIYAATSCD